MRLPADAAILTRIPSRKAIALCLLLGLPACSAEVATQPCAACAATGPITDELWREEQARAGKPVQEPAKPGTTHPCGACKGSGKVPK